MTKPFVAPNVRISFQELSREIYNIYYALYRQYYENINQAYTNYPNFKQYAHMYAQQIAGSITNSLYAAQLFFKEDRNDDHNKIKENFTLDLTGSLARKIAIKYLCDTRISYALCQGADLDFHIAKYPNNDSATTPAQMDDFFTTLKATVTRNIDYPCINKGNWMHFSYGILEFSATQQEAIEFLLTSMHVRINVMTGEFIFRDQESYVFFISRIIHISEMETFSDAQFDLGISFNQRKALEKTAVNDRDDDWHKKWKSMEESFIQVKFSRNRLAHFLYSITDLVRSHFTLHPETSKFLKTVIIKNEKIILHMYNKFLKEKNKKTKPADSLSTLIKMLFSDHEAAALILEMQTKVQEAKLQSMTPTPTQNVQAANISLSVTKAQEITNDQQNTDDETLSSSNEQSITIPLSPSKADDNKSDGSEILIHSFEPCNGESSSNLSSPTSVLSSKGESSKSQPHQAADIAPQWETVIINPSNQVTMAMIKHLQNNQWQSKNTSRNSDHSKHNSSNNGHSKNGSSTKMHSNKK